MSRFLFLFLVVFAASNPLICQAGTTHRDPAPEAFAAFAAGWVDYQMGHYAEAMRSFYDAALIDRRFSPGTTGMKACARALDFPQISAAIDRYESELAQKNPDLERFSEGIVPGLAFWGLYLDGEEVDYHGVGELEAAVEQQLKSLLGDRYVRIMPFERNTMAGGVMAAYEYNVLGLVSSTEDQVFLDLYFIQQWDVSTSERRGVESDPRAGVNFQRKRVSLEPTGFDSFFSGLEGEEFLTRFLNGENNDLPGVYIPRNGSIPLSTLGECSDDPFSVLSALAYQQPDLDNFRDIMHSGGLRTAELQKFIYAGLYEWFIDRFPLGSDEGSIVSFRHSYSVKPRFARELKSTDERQEEIEENYPDTLGSDLVLLHRLPENLNGENYESTINELRAVMRRICANPYFDNQIVFLFARAPDGRYYERVKRGPDEFGSGLLAVLKGNVANNAETQLIPWYRSIYILRGSEGFFQLMLGSRYIDYNWENLSAADKEMEASKMIRFHADSMREDIAPEELLAAFRGEPGSTYLFDLVTDVGYQLRRKGEIETDPFFHQLLELAFRHFNDEIRHPERKRIQLDFHLASGDHLRLLASESGFDRTPEGIQARRNTTKALVQAVDAKQWTELQKDVAMLRWRIAKSMDPQSEAEYAMVHEMFLPLIEDFLADGGSKNHSVEFYLDWLLIRKRHEFVIEFLDQHRGLLLERLPLEKKSADYHAETMARAVAVAYMKSGHPDRAIAFLKPFLYWGLNENRGRLSSRYEWLRLSQACAWYAEIALGNGDFEQARVALDRAFALAEGRNANRWNLSGFRQLNYWNDADYPTIQEYIVDLISRLEALEAR
ncbi:MAG: hypothetical protein ACLFS4_04470 [Opitutales bacterium]